MQQQQQQQSDEATAQPVQSGDRSTDWQQAEVISIEEEQPHVAVQGVDGQQDEEDILPLVPATVLLPVVVAIPADEELDMEELYSSMSSFNMEDLYSSMNSCNLD